ncbi:MAG: GAF domain-containing protein [Bacteroidia bacterium]|nr:GAF domain-containing protein [Bacteroidia bacterium]
MLTIDELDCLSKIEVDEFSNDGIWRLMHQFVSRATDFLKIERINIWLLNEDRNAIYSIAEYDTRYNQFKHHSWIYEKDIPNYFQHLKEDKIILAPNIHTHPATYELSGNYAKEHNVISLMDIPMRLNGKLIGVMCFEKTGNIPREFSEQEQLFAMALAQLTITHIENIKRKNIQKKLERSLKEKELIIKELNHRVKNNFSVLVSLLRLSKQSNIKEPVEIFETFEHQIFSMLKVHELLLESEQYSQVNLSEYLKKLCEEFTSSYPELKSKFKFKITDKKFEIPASQSIHLGIIITEIFLNSLKYCVIPQSGIFELRMHVLNNHQSEIIIGDQCNRFNFEQMLKSGLSLGLSIIKDLADSSGFEVTYPTEQDSRYYISIKK